MKKSLVTFMTVFLVMAALTGCEKKKEEETATATETYVDENEIQVVHHDSENVNFRISLVTGDMITGFERLREDARNHEAANQYHFYEYMDFSMFKSVFECGASDITTISLEEALASYREDPEFICILSINSEMEEGYGVTVATQKFARAYPFALQVFMEEMQYSAKEATCIVGEEMRTMIETYLAEAEEELPGDEFYYPLPEITDEEIIDVEEPEEND